MSAPSSWPDRVALVTGAGSGIGRSSAVAFAAAGAAVAVADLDATGGAETVASIAAAGGDAALFPADVSDDDQVADLVAAVVERFGRLDCAHNNAGIGARPAPTAEVDLAGWQRVLAVNLTGTFLCMRHEIPRMLEGGGGAIVNTASTFGLAGMPGLAPYTASKHGIIGLTRTAALEYATSGIRVNAVCPGPTDTPQMRAVDTELDADAAAADPAAATPMRRLAHPDEIASAVVWLCSDAASYVTGSAMTVDGGWLAQ